MSLVSSLLPASHIAGTHFYLHSRYGMEDAWITYGNTQQVEFWQTSSTCMAVTATNYSWFSLPHAKRSTPCYRPRRHTSTTARLHSFYPPAFPPAPWAGTGKFQEIAKSHHANIATWSFCVNVLHCTAARNHIRSTHWPRQADICAVPQCPPSTTLAVMCLAFAYESIS